MAKPRTDIYEAVTNDIIALLEQGTRPWQPAWDGGSFALPLRHNGVPYRGINVLALWVVAIRRGYALPWWLTYRQALELGGQVRKGEKGATVVYANRLVVEDEDGEEERTIPYLKRYTVFNIAQIEGLEEKYPAPAPILANPDSRDSDLEALFWNVGATIRHGGHSAHYQPHGDHIQMPEFEAFHSGDAYYATLAHEMVHWSGHQSRLNRKTLLSPVRADRAREELVAEIGAAFVTALVGLANTQREDHAAYVAEWLKALRNDKRAVFEAAREAQKAADYLIDRMQAGG